MDRDQNWLDSVKDAVFVKSETTLTTEIVRGYDFEQGVDYDAILDAYFRTGYQATALSQAIHEIDRMLDWRLSDEAISAEDADDEELSNLEYRQKVRCTIFLGYTSNLVSSGLREVIRYLAQNRMIDCIVTTAGGIEEDFIKCLAPTYVGDFHLNGAALRQHGLNRIGNLLVPNNNYELFENWLLPILDQCVDEQTTLGTVWSPSKLIHRLGKEINHTDSIYYWAYKNQIPVYSPALTDGSLGDMIYFHSYRKSGLILDIVQDLRALNTLAVHAKKTGMIILGGGLVKHHICNANLMRNGADFAVFVNTGQEFDGSDSGASPDEAVSWGKIRRTAQPVKVYADATLVFPLMVAKTFARKKAKVEHVVSCNK